MTNNYENAMVEKKNFTLPDMIAGEFTNEDMADDLEGLQISFQRVKIPGGGTLQFEMPGDNPDMPRASIVLEINHSHPITEKLKSLYESDKETLKKYARILYSTACLISGVALENPAELSSLVTDLMI